MKSHSLLKSNFTKGQIPAGPRGAAGPQGPTGAAGAPGAAGSAIAYGALGVNGNGNPEFDATLTKGFTSASSPSAGIYCIPYPAGVSTNIPLEISDNGNETAQWNQVANGQCGGSGYEIANITAPQGLSGGGSTSRFRRRNAGLGAGRRWLRTAAPPRARALLPKRHMIGRESRRNHDLGAARKRGVSMNESPVLVHVWEVDPAEESAAVAHLDEMFGDVVKDPGFVSARVLASADHASIAVSIEMRSAEDRQRLEQLPEVRETLDHLHGAANLVIRLYQEVASYGA